MIVMKVMLVDDETNSRDNIKLLIEKYCEGVQVGWEADSAEKALIHLMNFVPDIIFMDIEMPGLSGLAVANAIAEKKIPIIFVTAHDQYALEALKLGAVDYLLKPFKIAELQQAIERVQNSSFNTESANAIKKVVNWRNRNQFPLKVPWEGGFKIVDREKIIRIESDNSYSTLYVEEENPYVVSKSIGQLELELKSAMFFRIHNSHIINLNYLSSFSNHYGGLITLKNGKELPLARRRVQKFKDHVAQLTKGSDDG